MWKATPSSPPAWGRHAIHQDQLYFPLRPEDWIIGTWTALQPATRANGCLCVIPGSHKKGLLKHVEPDWEYVNALFVGAEGIELEDRVHIEMQPGDCLLTHSLLLHGSGHNRTSGFRRAILTHFASAKCERIENWNQLSKMASGRSADTT